MGNWGEPTWIASRNGRELAAWVHTPETEAESVGDGPGTTAPRGVLVVVPPVGRDHAVTYRSLRVLAQRAAREGFAVVRFAFSGTGESSPSSVPEGEHEWQEDLTAVLDWCKLTFGTTRIGGLGLRLGGTVLNASEDPRWAYRLVWDAVRGMRYLRQGAMLRAVSVPGEPLPEGVEHAGFRFTPARAAEVRALPPVRVPAWDGTLPAADAPAVFAVTSSVEQARLLHEVASIEARVPLDLIAQIIAAAVALGGPEASCSGTVRPRAEARFRGPSGRELVETLVVTDGGVPGILTAPAEPQETDAERSALFVGGAAEPKDGPTGLWVQAARELAEQGVIAFRPELPDRGDLAGPDAVRDPNPHTAAAVESLVETSRWMQRRTGRLLTGVGLCSGAWLVLRAAEQGVFERVVAVNNLAWRDSLAFHQRIYDEGLLEVLPESVELAEAEGDAPAPSRSRVAVAKQQAKDLSKRILQGPAPYGIWRFLGTRAKADVPELMLGKVAPETDVELVFSAMDRDNFVVLRGAESLERLEKRRPRPIGVQTHEDLDHSLLGGRARARMLSVLRSYGW